MNRTYAELALLQSGGGGVKRVVPASAPHPIGGGGGGMMDAKRRPASADTPLAAAASTHRSPVRSSPPPTRRSTATTPAPVSAATRHLDQKHTHVSHRASHTALAAAGAATPAAALAGNNLSLAMSDNYVRTIASTANDRKRDKLAYAQHITGAGAGTSGGADENAHPNTGRTAAAAAAASAAAVDSERKIAAMITIASPAMKRQLHARAVATALAASAGDGTSGPTTELDWSTVWDPPADPAHSLPLPGVKVTAKTVTLSQWLRSAPRPSTTEADANKLSAVGKHIRCVDRPTAAATSGGGSGGVPARYRAVTSVYLGNNYISDCDGFTQFQAMKVLSLANNHMSSFVSLSELSSCAALENLYLDGNPLCHIPNYRAHVLTTLPRLTSLDGQRITPAERAAARVVIAREQTAIDTAYMNDRRIHKLTGAVHRMRVHAELLTAAYGGLFKRFTAAENVAALSGNASELETNRFLDLINPSEPIAPNSADDADARRRFRGTITQRVYREWSMSYRHLLNLHAQPSLLAETWESAFASVIAAQQKRIAACARTLEAMRERIRALKHSLQLKHQPRTAVAAVASPKSGAAIAGRALKFDRPATAKRVGNRSVLKSALKHTPKSTDRKVSQSSTAKTPNRTAAAAAPTAQELSFDSTTNSLLASTAAKKKIGSVRRLSNAGAAGAPPAAAPPNSTRSTTTTTTTRQELDAADEPEPIPQAHPQSQSQYPPATSGQSTTRVTTHTASDADVSALMLRIAALQDELEKRTQQSLQLSALNEKLRERLEMFRKQNVENVSQAEAELLSLHNQLEAATAARIAAEADRDSLRGELQRRIAEIEHVRSLIQTTVGGALTDATARTFFTSQAEQLTKQCEQLNAELVDTKKAAAIDAKRNAALVADLQQQIVRLCGPTTAPTADGTTSAGAGAAAGAVDKLVDALTESRRAIVHYRNELERVSSAAPEDAVEPLRSDEFVTKLLLIQRRWRDMDARAAVRRWKLFAARRRKTRASRINRARESARAVWKGWRAALSRRRIASHLIQRLNAKRVRRAWSHWIRLHHHARTGAALLVRAIPARNQLWKRTAIARWRQFVDSARRRKNEREAQLLAVADKYRVAHHLSRAVNRWRARIIARRPRLLRMRLASAFDAGRQRARLLAPTRRAVARWRRMTIRRRSGRERRRIALRFVLRKMWSRWRAASLQKRLLAKAKAFSIRRLVRPAWREWRRSYVTYIRAGVHSARACMRRAFLSWIAGIHEQRTERAELRIATALICRRYIKRWRGKVLRRKSLGHKTIAARVHRRSVMNRKTANMFIRWRSYARRNKRLEMTCFLLRGRALRTIMNRVFSRWHRATVRRQHSVASARAQSLEDELFRYRDRLAQASADQMTVQRVIDERTAAITSLQHQLENKDSEFVAKRRQQAADKLIESSLRDHITEQKRREAELLGLVANTKQLLALKSDESNQTARYWQKQVEQQQRTARDLESVLKANNNVLLAVDSILTDTSSQLANTPFDSVDASKRWLQGVTARVRELLRVHHPTANANANANAPQSTAAQPVSALNESIPPPIQPHAGTASVIGPSAVPSPSLTATVSGANRSFTTAPVPAPAFIPVNSTPLFTGVDISTSGAGALPNGTGVQQQPPIPAGFSLPPPLAGSNPAPAPVPAQPEPSSGLSFQHLLDKSLKEVADRRLELSRRALLHDAAINGTAAVASKSLSPVRMNPLPPSLLQARAQIEQQQMQLAAATASVTAAVVAAHSRSPQKPVVHLPQPQPQPRATASDAVVSRPNSPPVNGPAAAVGPGLSMRFQTVPTANGEPSRITISIKSPARQRHH